jgi:hypothetical protein
VQNNSQRRPGGRFGAGHPLPGPSTPSGLRNAALVIRDTAKRSPTDHDSFTGREAVNHDKNARRSLSEFNRPPATPSLASTPLSISPPTLPLSLAPFRICEHSLHTLGKCLQVGGLRIVRGDRGIRSCSRIPRRPLDLAPFRDVEVQFRVWYQICLHTPHGLLGQTFQSSAPDGIRTAET